MKIMLFSLLFSLTCYSVSAQHLSVSVFGQSSELGLQRGYTLAYETDNWGIGFAFQSSGTLSLETANSNHPFIGITLAKKLYSASKMRLLLSPKLGFINRKFLVLIPEIQSEVYLMKNVKVGLGPAIRARKPAASLAITYQIFN